MNKKVGNSTPSRRQQLRYMRVLDQCSENISEAARMLGLSRKTLHKYKKLMWEEYKKEKEEVFDDSLTVEVKKLDLAKNLDVVSGKIAGTFDLVIESINQRIKDNIFTLDKHGNRIYDVQFRDLVNAVNALAPYIAEKRGVAGAKEDELNPLSRTTSFVQNIINVMNARSQDKQLNETNIEEGEANEIE